MSEKLFYSNGKLLLSGEYAVLDGALSLAVPTKYGQLLSVKKLAIVKLFGIVLMKKGTRGFLLLLQSLKIL